MVMAMRMENEVALNELHLLACMALYSLSYFDSNFDHETCLVNGNINKYDASR